jgi:cell division protein FtsI (penicillin-binding protein 3)
VIRRTRYLRSLCVCVVLVLCFAFLYYRLSVLQIIRHKEFLDRGLSLHQLNQKIDPHRGNIYDCNGRPLAMSVSVKSAYAVPEEISSLEKTAQTLARFIPLSESEIFRRLEKKKKFVWLARKLDAARVERLEELRLEGIGFREEIERVYPQGELLSHVLGFVDIDNRGLEGLELEYDSYLRGQSGWRASKRDRKGREIMTLRNQDIPPIDGCDIMLTVDTVIQSIAEDALEKGYQKSNAVAGSIIVLNPETGALLAMANRPTFDPNHPGDATPMNRRNRCIADIFEPGSTFKVVSVAAAVDAGSVAMDDRFYCEDGAFHLGRRVLHDVHAYKELTTEEIIQKSSNIGAVKVAMQLGNKPLYAAVRRFGFGSMTGIGLPGEVGGIVRPLRSWTSFSIASVPMGHEIGVTALQMAVAVGAIANGGLAMKPYIISEIKNASGEVVKQYSPQVRGRVVSDRTASSMIAAMERVVSRGGTAPRAILEEYVAAGKTGTSQKIEPDGRYSHSKFIGSFIGFAPARDPAVLIIVTLDEPRPAYYGGTVAAPVFKEVASKVLKYLAVPPDKLEGNLLVASY